MEKHHFVFCQCAGDESYGTYIASLEAPDFEELIHAAKQETAEAWGLNYDDIVCKGFVTTPKDTFVAWDNEELTAETAQSQWLSHAGLTPTEDEFDESMEAAIVRANLSEE